MFVDDQGSYVTINLASFVFLIASATKNILVSVCERLSSEALLMHYVPQKDLG